LNEEKRKIINIPVTGPDQEAEKVNNSGQENKGTDDCAEKLIRLQAEFVNFKKRAQREKDQMFSFAKGELVQKLLPVIDDMERMNDYKGEQSDHHLQGMNLIYQKMMKILFDEGLEEIKAKGEIFNPEMHEAVSVEETEQYMDNRVTDVWQKGYLFKGRLLRPSKVKVGKSSERTMM